MLRHYCLLLVVVFSIFSPLSLWANQNPEHDSVSPCERLLSTAERHLYFQRVVDEFTAPMPPLEKIYTKIKIRLLRERILQQCLVAGACTEESMRVVLDQTLGDVLDSDTIALHRSERRGYLFLVGGILINATASTALMLGANPALTFRPLFLSYVLNQFTLIYANTLSPFTEPISARVRRFSYALKESAVGVENLVSRLADRLTQRADVTDATYSLRQLHATDRIFVFRNAVRLNFETAAIALRNDHYAAAVAQIADAAINGYHYFRDIAHDEPAIVNAFRATMLLEKTSIDRHQFLEDVLIYIRQTERHPPSDIEPYCREIVLGWVGDSS